MKKNENLKNWQLEVSPDEKNEGSKNWQSEVSPNKKKWNKNLESWQSEVSPDMWMKIGELAYKGKSIPR